MRVFYVLHIKERALSDCLETIRFLCNPAEKHRAHVTVRGPYRKRIDVNAINRRIAGEIVLIDDVGNFFDSGQNTVFFRCSAPELRTVWSKPHYPFNPHITLYDSGSSEFAHKLFSVASKYTYCLRFPADQLEAIESRKGQASFSLAMAFNSELVYSVVGEKVCASDVRDLTEERRLQIVEHLCKHLSSSVAHSSTPFQSTLRGVPPFRVSTLA
jgi:hypothetical protein